MPVYALGELTPVISPTAFIHPEAVIIGSVEIGEESSVWPGAVLRGDREDGIVIGARTSIQDNSVVHTTRAQATTVGDDCVIGHLVHLEGCTIEDGCLVGSGSIVLHHAVVQTGALVGAAALVPNHMVVPSGAMALGVPAKIKPESVTPDLIARAVEAYIGNTRRYRQDLRRIG
jgi:carbonic anhydrase/acetyltransferase-like protein (isoleucine patch superfamily)